MKIDQLIREEGQTFQTRSNQIGDKSNANLVLVFGGRNQISSDGWYGDLKKLYPNADVISCSTAGEIQDIQVTDNTITATAIHFEKTPFSIVKINIDDHVNSYEAGNALSTMVEKPNLSHLMVLSNGHKVNGTDLVNGIYANIDHHIPVTGGLAGDGANFQKTYVGLNSEINEGNVVAVAFYGNDIIVGHGSKGGWDPFGPQRSITRSEGNVLYELDGQRALDLYKTYLGEKAAGLPGTALLFPLSIQVDGKQGNLVRTILNVNEEDGSMIFAGDIPQGARAQLMKYNSNNLIEGASEAAEEANTKSETGLAILISCVGRKLVLGHRVEEEVEAVRDELGENFTITGFYSYGEICPILSKHTGELHNQTMTITTISEAA